MKFSIKRAGLLLTFLIGMIFGLNAQSSNVRIVVTLNDGTEQSYDMTDNSRMYFENNSVLVIDQGIEALSLAKFPLANIRKIICDELVDTEEFPTVDMDIFPNPVHDVMTICNLTSKQIVNIYALDGRLMKSFEISGSQPVDVSDLPTGLYVVNINYNTYKMMKL